jgi:transposase
MNDSKSKNSKRYPLPFTEARSNDFTLSSYTIGALPLVNRILERMRLEEFIDGYLKPRGRKPAIPYSKVLLLLLRNLLISREPLYGVGEWAARQAPDLLGIQKKQIKHMNDDRVGRSLDRLFDADHVSLLLSVTRHVIGEFHVDLDQLHNDSTTITFFGKYENAFKGKKKRGKLTRAILHGHNKDHRPDLKQLLFILTVSRDGGVPIHFTASDGNVTDDQTHRQTWDLLCDITGRKDFLYVADSKLATTENMTYLQRNGGRFITVLPRTRSEDSDFRGLVCHNPDSISWTEIWRKTVRKDNREEVHDIFSMEDTARVTSEGFRLFWFHSLSKEERDRLNRAKKIERALQALGDLKERLWSPKTRFQERSKVQDAVDKLLKKTGASPWILVKVMDREQIRFRQDHCGRPGKNTRYVKDSRMRFDITFEIDTVAVAADSLTDGIFPLTTNDTQLSALDALLAYKGQPTIEKRFSQLKTDFEVAPVYLKEVARIEALLCLYFFVLVVQALIEREIRNQMVSNKIESLPLYPEGRKCRTPSTRRMIDLFDNIQRHELVQKGMKPKLLITELTSMQKKVLKLLGMTTRHYKAD